jgi:phosphatidylinositol alpha-mannosyltransferase
MPAKTKRLKIGLVLDTSLDQPDGVQQYVLALGDWLRSKKHDVHYLVGQTARQDIPNVHSLSRNVSVQSNGNRTTIPLPTSKRRLKQFMAQNNFDVLHVQSPHHPLLAQRLVAHASPRAAVIGTFHVLPYGWLPQWGTKVLGWWLRPSLRRFDAMLAVSPAAAEFERWSFGLDAKVLPNVIDFPRFHDAKPLKQYDDKTLTILFLGRLVPRKGCETLLRAISQLVESKQKKLPKFRVVICGRGPLLPKLQKYIKDHDLENIVSFTGFVSEEEKPRYYASADIAVFPSSGGESFGIVLLEAMASGHAAVLAGNNPGYRSVLSPRQELLFDPTDAAALAVKLRTYLTDTKHRNDAKRWSAAYAETFDVSVVGKQLLRLYRQTLRKRLAQ